MTLDAVIKSLPNFRGNFVGGGWVVPSDPSGQIRCESPANIEWQLPELFYSLESVELAVDHANRALKTWRHLSIEERVGHLQSLGTELDKRKEAIAELIAVETGKPIDECLGEAGLLKAKIDLTVEHALELVKTQYLDFGDKGKAEIHWRPKGVLAIIGPFNFPVHLSNGHMAPALLMGNVCLLKPSERTPYCAQAYFEAVEASTLPKGVLQLVHGDAQVATRLIRHVDIDGVLATCSYEVGIKIRRELAEKTQKIVALEMGGKNAAIISKTYKDEDKLSDALIRSAFLSTGQRCTALSRVYFEDESFLEVVLKRLHEKTKDLVISHPFARDPSPFMGPLISKASQDKFIKYSGIAQSEGAECVMRPKVLEGKSTLTGNNYLKGHYVSPSIHRVPKWSADSSYQNHEIFGPDLFFTAVESIDDAIDAVNANDYGLSFSYFGENRSDYDYVADRVQCGLVYYNRPTVGASGRLPFGGWGQSGNHRPAGLFAIYCSTQVQARIL